MFPNPEFEKFNYQTYAPHRFVACFNEWRMFFYSSFTEGILPVVSINASR